LEQRVVQMRQRYPDWGARKLQVLLAREKVELRSREEIDFVLCSLSFKILPWRFFARGL
jgi:hypothetical protein